MKIQYRHTSDPDVEKVYDTVKSLQNNPFIQKTQEIFDAEELIKFGSDMHIIKYQIID